MSEIIKESMIKEQPIPVTLEGTRIILNQMENCICKIYKDNGAIGTGFFCEIPFMIFYLIYLKDSHIINFMII